MLSSNLLVIVAIFNMTAHQTGGFSHGLARFGFPGFHEQDYVASLITMDLE
jgi:hypothetical protein